MGCCATGSVVAGDSGRAGVAATAEAGAVMEGGAEGVIARVAAGGEGGVEMIAGARATGGGGSAVGGGEKTGTGVAVEACTAGISAIEDSPNATAGETDGTTTAGAS